MGLDVGDKRIGVALSDPVGMLASPLTIIERKETGSDIQAIVKIIEQNQAGKVVVGLPRSMDGSIGRQAEKVQAFVRGLVESIKVPVEFRDERLSTISARRLMREVKKNTRKTRDDAIAAALILQDFLDEVQLQQEQVNE